MTSQFYRSDIWADPSGVLSPSYPKAVVRCQLGPGSHGKLKVLFQSHLGVGRIHFLVSVEFMRMASSRPAENFPFQAVVLECYLSQHNHSSDHLIIITSPTHTQQGNMSQGLCTWGRSPGGHVLPLQTTKGEL